MTTTGYRGYSGTMRLSFYLAALLFASLHASPVVAQPADSQQREVVSRSKLVVETDKAVNEWESRSQDYASKEHLDTLRTLLQSLTDDLSSLGERETNVRDEVEQRELRVKELRRPGF